MLPLAKAPGSEVRAAGPPPPVDARNSGGNCSKPHLNREGGGGRGEHLLTSNPVKIFYTICLRPAHVECVLITPASVMCVYFICSP